MIDCIVILCGAIVQVTDNTAASVMGIDRRFTELCIFEMLANDTQSIEDALAAYNQSLAFNDTDGQGPSSLDEMMYSQALRQLVQSTSSQVVEPCMLHC